MAVGKAGNLIEIKNKMIRLFSVISIVLLGILACSKDRPDDPGSGNPDLPEKETHHPFLIVKKDMYPALREKASQDPWKSMKTDAISRSQAGTSNDAYKLQEFIGAAALSYILDEGNKTICSSIHRCSILPVPFFHILNT